jgi:uncharacterized membrane protein
LLPVILLISILLGLLPLAGIVWMLLAGSLFTVDGLFESLILLSLSGIFFLNVLWELRDSNLLPFGAKAKGNPKPPAPEGS